MMSIARCLLGLVILVVAWTNAARLEAEQRGDTQRAAPPQSARTHPSKTELVGRLQSLKEQYGALKTRAAKYVPLQPSHPPPVLQTRSELDTSMRACDKAEREIQASLDATSELSDTESLRLQMAMDRLSKLMQDLSNIMKKLSDTGDAITKNIK